MFKYKILPFLFLLLFVFSACHKDDDEKTVSGVRTVLVYIAAYNSLGSLSLDSDDVEEMIAGMKNIDVSKNNLLIYWAAYGKNPKLIRLGRDNKGAIVQETVATYDSQNSVSVDVMKSVFSTAFSQYPADSYGVVFWSHGDGWLPSLTSTTRWWGQDLSNREKYMNIPDLHEALLSAPHFDFILFDACFMQSVEVVYQLRDCADYFIGSPTEIPGPGAPYDVVVPAMFSANKPEIAIAESYFNAYAANYNDKGSGNSNKNWTAGVSVSVVKSSELDGLAVATRDIVNTANSMKATHLIDVTSLLCYDPKRNKNYYDLMGIMETVQEEALLFENYKVAFQNAVIWKSTTRNNYCTNSAGFGYMTSMKGFEGLSAYVFKENATSQNQYYRQSIEWYAAAGWSEFA